MSTSTEPLPAVWGIETALDVHDCNPQTIRDADKIREYVNKLCEIIEMKQFHPACESCGTKQNGSLVVNFGEEEKVAGYSMVQLIETSLISGHFANLTNRAYINIFSCKVYDIELAKKFTCEFFEGHLKKTIVNERE